MKKQRLIAMVISMIFLLTGCLHNNGKGNIRIESEEEQTKETEISPSTTDQLAEQPEDATPSKPKSKSKSKK